MLSAGATGMYAMANDKKDEDTNKAQTTSAEPEKKNEQAKDENGKTYKEETVYVMTKANGSKDKVIVSDWLKNPKGLTDLKDNSKLSNIENTKTDETFEQSGTDLTWKTEGGDIYYKGDYSGDLPVDMKVTYKLDGTEISPENLLGKSGKVTIRYDFENKTEQTVTVNGKEQGEFTVKSGSTPSEVEMQVYLNAGENTVAVLSSWTWFALDYIRLDKPSEDRLAAALGFDRELSNPNAGESTEKLWAFLTENYGNHVLVGQVSDKLSDPEMPAIKKATGTYPAIMGFDFMDYSPSRRAHGTNPDAVDNALEWVNGQKGIVTFHWHWNVPEPYLIDQGQGKLESGQDWWSGFYQTAVDAKKFDLRKIMNGEDPEGYDLLMRDIDAIAEQLMRLKEAGIPVLWRPLHEASGGWFWWGAYGPDAYKKLYVTLYDRLTNEHGLDNLIWVWNGQAADWYPGDEYVDIIGEDIYAGERVYSAQTAKFMELLDYPKTNKITALTENGTVFDIDNAIASNTRWSWFNTWCGDFVTNGSGYSERYTEESILKKAYDSEYVITLDELPKWN